MGDRRMLTKKVTDADEFIGLPSSAQALYLHLNMGADDDGFNNQVQLAVFKAHASIDDVKLLMAKRYIIQFDTGVIVIKHWRMANALRNDRYKPTNYQEELAKLKLKTNGSYTFKEDWLPNGCQTDATTQLNLTQPNGTELNISCSEESEPNRDVDEVIDHLNMRTGQHYRHSESSRKHIRARLQEKFTVQDCKDVIDKKCVDWMGTEYEQYLRPNTLFAPGKFEGYLNAPVKQKKGQNVF